MSSLSHVRNVLSMIACLRLFGVPYFKLLKGVMNGVGGYSDSSKKLLEV